MKLFFSNCKHVLEFPLHENGRGTFIFLVVFHLSILAMHPFALHLPVPEVFDVLWPDSLWGTLQGILLLSRLPGHLYL